MLVMLKVQCGARYFSSRARQQWDTTMNDTLQMYIVLKWRKYVYIMYKQKWMDYKDIVYLGKEGACRDECNIVK